jgi:alkylhydroperoxidase family enzyme
MIKRLIDGYLAREERRLGSSTEYLRHIAHVSVPAILKFGLFMPLASHRKVLPADAYHVARLAAVQAEDCGSCVQTEVNLARASGVPREVIHAVLDHDPARLPAGLDDVFRFADAVATRAVEADELRERLLGRYGEEGLLELALAIAVGGVFPTVKRALGYAVSCERVELRL